MDLERLCAASGTEWVEAAVRSIDARGGRLELDSRRGVRFDLASIDVGSVPAGLDLPGVRQHAWPLRPLSRITELRDRLDALARNRHRAPVTVVGGGAAGIETALAVHRRMVDAGGRPRVTVADGADRLLTDYPERARALVRKTLDARGIGVRLGTFVNAVRADAIEFESGEALETALVVWATGASPPPLVERTGLRRSDRGYLAVDRTLRTEPADLHDGAPAGHLFGAGDCVDVAGRHLPRAGVYAVSEGKVLATNLRAFLAGEELTEYHPQSTFLSLVDTADGQALFSREPLVFRGHSARLLKDWIDRRFVRKYRRLELREGAVPRSPS